jgi:hypothetical protein
MAKIIDYREIPLGDLKIGRRKFARSTSARKLSSLRPASRSKAFSNRFLCAPRRRMASGRS